MWINKTIYQAVFLLVSAITYGQDCHTKVDKFTGKETKNVNVFMGLMDSNVEMTSVFGDTLFCFQSASLRNLNDTYKFDPDKHKAIFLFADKETMTFPVSNSRPHGETVFQASAKVNQSFFEKIWKVRLTDIRFESSAGFFDHSFNKRQQMNISLAASCFTK